MSSGSSVQLCSSARYSSPFFREGAYQHQPSLWQSATGFLPSATDLLSTETPGVQLYHITISYSLTPRWTQCLEDSIIWTIYYIVCYLVIYNFLLFTCLHHFPSKLVLTRRFSLLLCYILSTLSTSLLPKFALISLTLVSARHTHIFTSYPEPAFPFWI